MTIPLEDVGRLLEGLAAADVQQLIAQAEARQLLYETGEPETALPEYAPQLDERVTALAYAYLSAGCSLAEHGQRGASQQPLERAAKLLRDIHQSKAKSSRASSFNLLVAAMAAYAAGQYSWAFVMLRAVRHRTDAARLVSAFLNRDRKSVQAIVARIVLAVHQETDSRALVEIGVARALARAIACAVEFAYSGERKYLERAHQELEDASVIATAASAPAWWWMSRVLALMIADLDESSPWTILPPLLGEGNEKQAKLEDYIQHLALGEKPSYELWRSQRAALPEALGANAGAVVSLKTSGGKTRIAEIAMLQALTSGPDARVVFLAPFRSLAFEMEQTFVRTFRPLGFEVSHLYGGFRANRGDEILAESSHIIVATPEKARALFRAAPDLFSSVRLIVIDEGHLIGGERRDIRNEMYYEHLRVRAKAIGARLLLLSAALPNAGEIAKWIASNESCVGTSPWRPSLQRVGRLCWTSSEVRLDWQGDVASTNSRFVLPVRTGTRKNSKLFPADVGEAVAAGAVRLAADEKTVMIFTAQARSVPRMARSVVQAMRLHKDAGAVQRGELVDVLHDWPKREWATFEALCEEELPPDAIEFCAARAGVICHSDALPAQVREAMERLMRAGSPRVVIATRTLAQGVNLGVSTVIVASTLVTQGKWLTKRDFLNIAGRAGRAFVDLEGRLLYAFDETKNLGRQIRRANEYLHNPQIGDVTSGVLLVVRYIKSVADGVGIRFARLLELALENDFSEFGASRGDAEELCDHIDDALLALHEDVIVNEHGAEPVVWVERFFRQSLAALQATKRFGAVGLTDDHVVSFLVARAGAALRRAPTPQARRAVVASSLPFRAALRVYDDLTTWRSHFQAMASDADARRGLLRLVTQAEEWLVQNVPFLYEDDVLPDAPARAKVRAEWLAGTPIRLLLPKHKNALKICRRFYGLTLSWLLHAVSQQLRAEDDEHEAELAANAALCVENGLPSAYACYVQLAGIRSRAAAAELATMDVDLGDDIGAIRRSLSTPGLVAQLAAKATAGTQLWLRLAYREWRSMTFNVRNLQDQYDLPGMPQDEVLVLREHDGKVFLTTIDGRASMLAPGHLVKGRRAAINDPRTVVRYDDVWRNAWYVSDRTRPASDDDEPS